MVNLATNKQYGATFYFESLGVDIRDKLEKHFPAIWQHIWVMALLRTEDPQPFKRLEQTYEHSWLSEKYPGGICQSSLLAVFYVSWGICADKT